MKHHSSLHVALLLGAVLSMTLSVHAQSVQMEPRLLAHFDVMPKVLAAPDGTLVSTVIVHRGPGLEPTPLEQVLLTQESTDGGKTWSDRQAVGKLPPAEGGFGFGVPMIDRGGEIHVFLLCNGNTGAIRARTTKGVGPVEPIPTQKMDVWHVRSTGSRTLWTTPKRIWEGRAADLVSATQLHSGRIILPVASSLAQAEVIDVTVSVAGPADELLPFVDGKYVIESGETAKLGETIVISGGIVHPCVRTRRRASL